MLWAIPWGDRGKPPGERPSEPPGLSPHPRKKPPQLITVAATAAAAILLLGSAWYVRNFWVTGTPVYPLGFSEETDLWGTMRPQSFTSTLLGCGRPVVWGMLLDAILSQAGPCQLFAVLLLPTVLIWLAFSVLGGPFLSGSPRTSVQDRLVVAVVLVLSFCVYIVTPNTVETARGAMNMIRSQYHPIRFGLSFFSVALLALAIALDDRTRALSGPVENSSGQADTGRLRPRRWLATSLVLLAGLAVLWQAHRTAQPIWSPDVLLLTIDVLLVTAIAVLFWWLRDEAFFRRGGVVLAMPAVGCLAWGISVRADRWHREFPAFYDARYRTDAFTTLTSYDPQRERIAVFDYRYYPFLGSRRQYNVCRPLWIPTPERLLEYVDREGITLLAPRRSHRNGEMDGFRQGGMCYGPGR